MPAISPGAPVPAPKYVPFNYGKMTPGNYFSHTSGFSDGFHGRGLAPEPRLVDDVYKHGVRATLRSNAKRLHPTAWNYKVPGADLGSPAKNKLLMDRMTHPQGLSNSELRSQTVMRDTGTGQKFIETKPAPKGAVYSKPKWSTYPGKNHKPPIIPRKPGMSGTTFILKGSPNMFHEIGPDYKHRPDLPKLRPGSKALSDIWDGGKGALSNTQVMSGKVKL